MNFSAQNALLKNFICLLACSLLYPIKAAQLPWYHTYFHKKAGTRYAQNNSLIDFAQKIRYVSRILYYRASHKKNELDQALFGIQTELKRFELMLSEWEKDALLAIKDKYGIHNDVWHQYLHDVEKVKNSYRLAMTQPHKEVTHDPAIPAEIQEMLIAFLKENNINPHSINFIMSNEEQAHNEPNTLAFTILYTSTENIQNRLIVSQEYIPAEIIIFPSLLQKPRDIQISTCAHEIQHLVSQHPVSLLILYEYLAHYCSVEKTEFEQTTEYHELTQIYEAQAEILAALANPYTARAMKAERQEFYYPNTLYEEHFYHLSSIDMLWKLHDKLEALYFS
jgi:hypothetical protein